MRQGDVRYEDQVERLVHRTGNVLPDSQPWERFALERFGERIGADRVLFQWQYKGDGLTLVGPVELRRTRRLWNVSFHDDHISFEATVSELPGRSLRVHVPRTRDKPVEIELSGRGLPTVRFPATDDEWWRDEDGRATVGRGGTPTPALRGQRVYGTREGELVFDPGRLVFESGLAVPTNVRLDVDLLHNNVPVPLVKGASGLRCSDIDRSQLGNLRMVARTNLSIEGRLVQVESGVGVAVDWDSVRPDDLERLAGDRPVRRLVCAGGSLLPRLVELVFEHRVGVRVVSTTLCMARLDPRTRTSSEYRLEPPFSRPEGTEPLGIIEIRDRFSGDPWSTHDLHPTFVRGYWSLPRYPLATPPAYSSDHVRLVDPVSGSWAVEDGLVRPAGGNPIPLADYAFEVLHVDPADREWQLERIEQLVEEVGGSGFVAWVPGYDPVYPQAHDPRWIDQYLPELLSAAAGAPVALWAPGEARLGVVDTSDFPSLEGWTELVPDASGTFGVSPPFEPRPFRMIYRGRHFTGVLESLGGDPEDPQVGLRLAADLPTTPERPELGPFMPVRSWSGGGRVRLQDGEVIGRLTQCPPGDPVPLSGNGETPIEWWFPNAGFHAGIPHHGSRQLVWGGRWLVVADDGQIWFRGWAIRGDQPTELPPALGAFPAWRIAVRSQVAPRPRGHVLGPWDELTDDEEDVLELPETVEEMRRGLQVEPVELEGTDGQIWRLVPSKFDPLLDDVHVTITVRGPTRRPATATAISGGVRIGLKEP